MINSFFFFLFFTFYVFGSRFRTLAASHVSDFWASDGLRPENGLGLTLYCRRASHVCGPLEPPPGWRTSRSGGLAARGSMPGCWCCSQRRWVAPRTPQSARVNCSPSGEEFFCMPGNINYQNFWSNGYYYYNPDTPKYAAVADSSMDTFIL